MPIAVYLSRQGIEHHKKIEKKLLKVNTLPNISRLSDSFTDKDICIICVTNDTVRKKLLVTERFVLALEGDVLNVTTLSDLLELYQKYGNNLPDQLNGNFNLIIYKRETQILKVFNCRSSLYDFYYYQQTDYLIFSSNLNSICVVAPDAMAIDYQSLYKLFSAHYIFGDGTLLQGVTRLAPASNITVIDYTLTKDTYWNPVFKDHFDLDLTSLTEEFNKRLIGAVKERFSYFKDIKIFLSGGLDSRLIAAAAEKAGLDTETVTYGFAGANDVVFGEMISQKLGYKNNQYITQPGISTKYSDILSLVIWLSGFDSNIKSMTSFKYHDFLINSRVTNYSHGSTIGLVSSKLIQPYMLLPISEEKKIQITFDRLTMSNSSSLQSIFRDDFINTYQHKALQEFTGRYKTINGCNFVDKFISWYVLNREPRTTYNSMKINGYYFNCICFFLDRNLLDFYFRVPLKYRQEALWEKKACLTLNEKIKDVPYHATGEKISVNLTYNLWARVKSKLIRNTKYADKVRHKDSRSDTLTDERLREYILDNVKSRSGMNDIVSQSSVEQLVKDHFSQQSDNTKTVLNLASLFKFIDIFLDKRCADLPTDAAIMLNNIPYPQHPQ